MTSAAELMALPFMPGFTNPTFKDRHHKPQTWNIVNHQRIEQKVGLSHDKPKFVKAARPVAEWRTGSLPDSSNRACFKASGEQMAEELCELPAWDAYDRHVLRFYGHFKEAVVETNLENFRVRKIVILFYLEDDTAQIIEPRQDNSGIPQGQLIRRHRFPHPTSAGYLMPEDLKVGEILRLYGRTMMVTDCDDFTRDYYMHHGEEQAPPVQEETDPFSQTQEAMKAKSAAQPRTYEKIYREVMLGGGHINADMQQFLENDKRVLRFFATMDDLRTPQFERRPFVILFFLADETMEIREMYPLNCGRDNFPIFFRRGKMPRGNYKVDGPQGPPRKKSEFVHGQDLAVNMAVELIGQSFFIYDVDDFTRKYFKEELGFELEPKLKVELPERAVPRAETPPYTGYGSWDDSMSSVTHLIPKPPKKDFKKLYKHDRQVLRFKARFLRPKPEDVDRVFVMCFHLQDDCLSIHEPPQRNLGIVTGKFLEKAVHMNQNTGSLFAPEDLLPGQEIKVYNHEFLMMDMDEYTRKMLADPTLSHTTFDLESVLQKVRESLRQQFPLVRDTFRRFDSSKDGVITFPEFKTCLAKFGFQLADDEAMSLMKHFDRHRKGQISYNDFCDTLLDEDYTSEMMKTKPALDSAFDADYKDKAAVRVLERSETDAVRKAAYAIGNALEQNSKVLTKVLKEIRHQTYLDTVTCAQLKEALERASSHPFDLADIKRCVLFHLPHADENAVNYVELFKAVRACFHDLAASR